MKSRQTHRGRVIIRGITHRVYVVNSVGVGGTACGRGFSQRPSAERRNMEFGQRTSHEAIVNCMACVVDNPGPAAPFISPAVRWPRSAPRYFTQYKKLIAPREPRWRDPRGITHAVIRSDFKRGWTSPGYIPACRAWDLTIVWPHPKYCPREVDCMACISIEAK